jgi:hypothetical protein
MDPSSTVGKIQLIVYDKLQAPSTAPDTVRILIEVCGAEDFEVAVPFGGNLQPVITYTPQMAGGPCELDSGGIGNSSTDTFPASTAYTIGEKLTSIRQILKRFTDISSAADNAARASYSIYPYALMTDQVTSSTYYSCDYYADPLAIWSQCYALMRGSVRIKQRPADPTVAKYYYSALDTTNSTFVAANQGFVYLSGASGGSRTWTQTKGLAWGFSDTPLTRAHEVHVPYINYSFASATADMQIVSDARYPAIFNDLYTTRPKTMLLTQGSTADKDIISRAAGDDFQLALWCSIPPVILCTGDVGYPAIKIA